MESKVVIKDKTMSLKSIVECERNNLAKLMKYQLPNIFKTIGFVVAIVCFVTVIMNKFTLDSQILRLISKYGITFGLLIVSISKEKIEDEYIAKIRMMSYSFAFIFAVLWTFANPFIVYAVESLVDKEPAVLQPNGDFQILWMLLAIQVFSFHLFKRIS